MPGLCRHKPAAISYSVTFTFFLAAAETAYPPLQNSPDSRLSRSKWNPAQLGTNRLPSYPK